MTRISWLFPKIPWFCPVHWNIDSGCGGQFRTSGVELVDAMVWARDQGTVTANAAVPTSSNAAAASSSRRMSSDWFLVCTVAGPSDLPLSSRALRSAATSS